MKIKRKKYILGILFFVILLIVINVFSGDRTINQSNINKSIDEYFNDDAEEGKVKLVSYEQLGSDRNGSIINQYSLMQLNTYTYENGTLKFCSSGIYPVRFKIKSFLGSNKVIECNSPQDGEAYSESLNELFPNDIIDKLNENYNEYSKKLQKQNDTKLDTLLLN